MARTVQASAPSSTPISTTFVQPPPSPPPFTNLIPSSYQPTDESKPLQRAEFHHSLALLQEKFHQSRDSISHNLTACQNHITAQIAALQSTMVQALTGQHQPIHSTVPPTPSSAPSFTLPPPTLTLATLPPITFESIPAPPLTPANLPPSTFGSIPPPILEGTSLPSLTAQLPTVSPAPPPTLTPHPPPLTTGNIPPTTFGSISTPLIDSAGFNTSTHIPAFPVPLSATQGSAPHTPPTLQSASPQYSTSMSLPQPTLPLTTAIIHYHQHPPLPEFHKSIPPTTHSQTHPSTPSPARSFNPLPQPHTPANIPPITLGFITTPALTGASLGLSASYPPLQASFPDTPPHYSSATTQDATITSFPHLQVSTATTTSVNVVDGALKSRDELHQLLKLRRQPEHVLDMAVVKKKKRPITQWLVQWHGLPAADATWEDAHTIKARFPAFCA